MNTCYLHASGIPRRTSGLHSHFILLGLSVPAGALRERHEQIVSLMNAQSLPLAQQLWWLTRLHHEEPRLLRAASVAMGLPSGAVRTNGQSPPSLAVVSGTELRRPPVASAGPHPDRRELHTRRLALLQALADLVRSWDDAVLFFEAHDTGATSTFCAADERIPGYSFAQVARRFRAFLARTDRNGGRLVQFSPAFDARSETVLPHRRRTPCQSWRPIEPQDGSPDATALPEVALAVLAGVGAYAVRQFLERGDADLLDRLYARVDRSNGRLTGGRHFTGKSSCDCRICGDRGRLPTARVGPQSSRSVALGAGA